MSSLAKQLQSLKALRLGNTLTPSRRRISLLFSSNEAADLDVEKVYAIGLSGLKELEEIDPVFVSFRETLFKENNMSYDRYMQTQEANAQLDEVLHDFLIRVSPYYLVRSAHKALEWLVFLYRIHEFNPESLMECILPHHDNPAFIKALRLIHIDENSKWFWLKTIQKEGIPLNRHMLISQCKKDLTTFKFICKMAVDFAKIHGTSDAKLRVVIGVVTMVLIGCLQNRQISEEKIAEAVSYIVNSLKNPCMQIRASGYMVAAQLLSEVQLQPKVLKMLLNLMAKKLCEPLFSCGLKSITIACYNQKVEELPQKCEKYLAKVDHPAKAVLEAYFKPKLVIGEGVGEAEQSMDQGTGSNDEEEQVPQVKTVTPAEDEVDPADEDVTCIKKLAKKVKKGETLDQEELVDALLKTSDKDKVYKAKRKLFKVLQVQTQQDLFSKLLDRATGNTCTKQLVAQKTLKKLYLQPAHVLHELQGQGHITESEKGKKIKRPSLAILDSKRITFTLEILTGRENLETDDDFVVLLFELLNRFTKEENNYCAELLLTILHMVTTHWASGQKSEKQELCEIELLVKCLRSTSPGVQQQSLMILADLAICFPEYTLHNAMSIFTLMGDCILQRDDAYTFKTVLKAMDTLIPILLKSQNQQGGSPKKKRRSVNASSQPNLSHQILQVFVSARDHVPKHRCTMLYEHLLRLLGTDEHAWVLVAQTAEAAVRQMGCHRSEEQDEHSTERPYESDLEFIGMVIGQLDVHTQLKTCQKLLNFLCQMTNLNASAKASSKDKSLPPLTAASLSSSQLRQIQYLLSGFTNDIIAKNDFILHMVEQLSSSSPAIMTSFELTVKETLSYFILVSKAHAQIGSSTPTGKFWKVTQTKVNALLSQVNYLLPSKIFLQLVQSLMQHELVGARKKALEILADKLQQITAKGAIEEESQGLLGLVDVLASMACQEDKLAESSQDDATLRQMALFCVKQITRMVGKQDAAKFAKVLEGVVELLQRCDDSQMTLMGSSLLCVGELCVCLKSLALEHFSVFMPYLCSYLSRGKTILNNEVQVNCALSATQKIISCLRNFISSYLPDILLEVCLLYGALSAEKRHQLSFAKLKSLSNHIATDISARVLFPVLKDTASNILQSDHPESLVCLFNILLDHIKVISKEDLLAHLPDLEEFFLFVLDIRCSAHQFSLEQRLELEDSVIKMVVATVSKLSEATFRPLYNKLYEWGCRQEEDHLKPRCVTFFRLSERLAVHLKSLFNLFINNTLDSAVKLLSANFSSQDSSTTGSQTDIQASCELLNYILGMLYQCFQNEGEALLTQELFDELYEPIINQIENMIGGKEVYQGRFENCVVQCITQLAVTCKEESWIKTLNYNVCMKARHSNNQVRFAAVKVLESMVKKMGEEYIPLLQETMPFLAELMEDESEEVEQEAKELAAMLENIVSEPLNSYF